MDSSNQFAAAAAAAAATRQLFRRGSIYTLTLGLQLSAGVLVIPALTRLLTREGYGTLAIALVVIQIVVTLASAGIPAAITRFFFLNEQGPKKSRALVSASFVVALPVAAITDLTGPLWSPMFEELTHGPVLRMAVWTVVPLAVVLASQAVLRAEDRVIAFVAVGGAASLVAQAAGLLALVVTGLGPLGYLSGFGLGVTIAAVLGAITTRPRVPQSIGLVRSALGYGLPTVPHSISLFLLSAGDRVVIERTLGLVEVARYQVAYVVGAVGIALAVAFNNAWAPIIYSSSDSHRADVLAKTAAKAQRLAGLGAGFIAIVSPLALRLAAPAEYARDNLIPVAAIVGLSVVPYVAYLSAVHLLFQHGKTVTLAWLTPSVAVLNVALNLALVPLLGLNGSAIATVLSYIVLALVVHRVSSALETVNWEYRSLAFVAGFSIVIVVFASLIPGTGVGAIIRTIVAVGLVGIGMQAIRQAA